MHSDLTWRRLIFGMSDGELRFSLQAITNTTPTPDNLRRWGNSEIDSACSLCGQTCTLRHVLNACKVSLLQGRYLWRHNLILGCLQKYLLDFWSSVKKENCAATAPFIRLVPEGTKAINLSPPPPPPLSPNPETSGVQRSSQMRKRLGLSFRPGNRADFPSGNCLHHTTTRHCNLLKV